MVGMKFLVDIINTILDEIDKITSLEQYQFIKASVVENIIGNKINLIFKIDETEKFYVERINIFGNSITQENVIRNQLELDEGDPFNEILLNKSINNLKSLNIFKNVNQTSNRVEVYVNDGTYYIVFYSDKIVETSFIPKGETYTKKSHAVILKAKNIKISLGDRSVNLQINAQALQTVIVPV